MTNRAVCLLATLALAATACTMDDDGTRRPPVRSSLIGQGASTSSGADAPASGWDTAPAAGEDAHPNPMRPASVTHGDPEASSRPPIRPWDPLAPRGTSLTDSGSGAPPAPSAPPYAEPLPVPPPLAPDPPPAPVDPGVSSAPPVGGSSGPRTSAVPGAPSADHPKLAPLLPGAKAPGASADDPLYFSFLGKELPDLAADGIWLTPGVAPTISGLRGQVVYLQFSFQSCPSCGLMTPYLQQWQQAYGPQGLSIVYVNNGLMANQDAAKQAIAEQRLLFPYFHDPSGETLRIFGMRAFPVAYVADRSGKVIWEGTPTANEAKIAEVIQAALAAK